MSSGRLKLINSCANRPELTIWQVLPDSVSGNLQGRGIIANFTLVKRLCMLKKVVAIVREAGALALKRDFTVESKGGFENLVTSADKEIQAFLADRLAEILPGSGFLGEENDLRICDREYVWIIDPIDGTANFSRGIPEYAVSVALSRKGRIILGVVFNPSTGDLFTARAGKGARWGRKKIQVSDRVFEDGLLCTAMSLYRKEFAPVCNRIIMDAYARCNDVRRFGGCALELCYLAAGLCDLYFELRVQPWDCAAALLILHEAGGFASGLGGAPLSWQNGPMLVAGANSAQNLATLNTIIGKHLKKLPYNE